MNSSPRREARMVWIVLWLAAIGALTLVFVVCSVVGGILAHQCGRQERKAYTESERMREWNSRKNYRRKAS